MLGVRALARAGPRAHLVARARCGFVARAAFARVGFRQGQAVLDRAFVGLARAGFALLVVRARLCRVARGRAAGTRKI